MEGPIYSYHFFMSENNEDHSEPGEAGSKSRQSRPSAKKRSTAKTRRPSKAADTNDQENDSKKVIATTASDEQGTSTRSANKQSTRRPAKKKSSSNQTQSARDGKSDKNPDDENQKPADTSDSANRKQSARRPAKRKSDSNRRRSSSSSRSSSRGGRQSRPKPALRLPPLNPEELQAKAWDLYRADINEESTAMFNEDEAVDLVRRSFILADIFLRFRDQLFDGGSAANEKPSDSSEAIPNE